MRVDEWVEQVSDLLPSRVEQVSDLLLTTADHSPANTDYHPLVHRPLLPACATLVVAGCLASCGTRASFESAEPSARLAAVRDAARRDDQAAIPRLIEMLDSDDPAVRLLSIRTLEKMVGDTMGYDYAAPAAERAAAVDRWERWYRTEQARAQR